MIETFTLLWWKKKSKLNPGQMEGINDIIKIRADSSEIKNKNRKRSMKSMSSKDSFL